MPPPAPEPPAADVETDAEPFALDDLLWLIAEMPRTPSTLDELLDDLELRKIAVDPDALAGLLAAAALAGQVAVWQHEDESYTTLTPLSAERLDVELGICSDRWFPRGRNVSREVLNHDDRRSMLESPEVLFSGYSPGDEHRPGRRDPAVYRDPTCPEPLDVLADLEPGGETLRDGHRVVVRQVLGIGLPWPQAFTRAEVIVEGEGFRLVRSVCRGCLDRQLNRNAYCALCHRCGSDRFLHPIEPALRPAAQAT